MRGPQPYDTTYTVMTPGGQLPDGVQLMLFVAPDCKGEDFQLGVEWYDANGRLLSSGPVDVYVDAVAQWANFVLDNADGVYGVTGEAPSELVSVDVHVGFLDQDGSEANYVLVEKVPGVLVLHRGDDGSFDTVREVYLEGRTYYQIEATAEEQRTNLVRLEFSVNEELLSPMYVRNDIVYDGMTFSGIRVDIGTMTVEGQTGWAESGSQPANWEYTLKNNTSLNLQDDALTIVVSRVNAKGGNSTVYTEETDTPEEHLVRIDPHDPRNGLNLAMDGNDVLDSLIITGISGNGAFWYEDEAGERHLVTVGMDVTESYLAGRLFHEQDRYRDDDAHLEWAASLHDGLSPASDVTVEGSLTVAVDAVARAAEISLGYPVIDAENHTLTQQLTFADHEGNEQHYAVIAPDLYRVIGREASVRDADGEWHSVEVETIFSPEGTPYYGVLLDGFLDEDGSVTVRFDMRELSIPGIENWPVVSGGVSIEPNSGFFPEDREPVLTNNWAINTEVRFVHEGTVSTRGLGLTADFIVEDDAAGSPLHLSGEMGANDVLVSAALTFAAAEGAALGAAGRQVATIVYGGACFAVIADGAGNANAEVPFGAQGFDPAADFRIIWGTAHVEDGGIVVDAFNHQAGGRLEFSGAFTVKNRLSDTETVLTAKDGDGIDLLPRADAAREVHAAATAINDQPWQDGAWVGAAEDTFTVTLGASFDDLDGSEAHYLLLEVPQGCEVVSPAEGDLHVHEGVRYYRIQVPAAEAAPAVSVTLRAADGTNQPLELKTAAMAVETEGQHTRYTAGPAIALRISDVSATGIDAAEAHTVEDVPLSLDFLATSALLNDDGNDELRSITFTDLKGGSLTDAAGNVLPGLTVSAAELAAGAVFYRPAANHAGELDDLGRPLPVELAYEAELGEAGTGATATLTGQKLTLFITPAPDAPCGVAASTTATELGDVQAGHKALLTVDLAAKYADVDGSEEHFFILQAPQGVAVADGGGYTVSTLSQAELAALTARFPDFAGAGQLYRLAVDGTQENISVSVALEVTTTVYNGGTVRVMGAAAEQLADGAYEYAFTAAPEVPLPGPVAPGLGNTAPEAQESLATLDSLRQSAASGSLLMDGIDPDGDDVTVSAVAGASLGTDAGGRPVYVAEGVYGTLHVYENGAYSYELREDARGAAGREVFGYTVSDGYGGAGESRIIIELTTPNTAPTAQDVAAELNSVRASTVSGTLALADSEGDAVTVAAVNGSSAMVNLGSEAEPRMGFEAAGEDGILRVYEEGGAWRYEYTLDPAHRGETRGESFSFTVKDAFGLQSVEDAVIEIGLFNDNADPVAENVHTAMDTLRDADRTAAGTAALSDAEGDPVLLAGASGAGGEGDWGQDESGARAFVVAGSHGTLYLYENGGTELAYRYVLTDNAAAGVSATESFTYRVRDDFSGKSNGTITIDLTNTNTAPEISGDLTGELDTLRSGGELAGSLAASDPDYNADEGRHDAVRLSMASFNGVAGAPDGAGGFTVRGAHGVFHIDAAGSYTYTLDADAAGREDEIEEFQITVTDEFGLESTAPVRIALVVHNQAPVVTDGHIRLDTLRDGGSASGSVTFTDADGDTVMVCALAGVTTGAQGTDPQGHEAYVARGAHGTLYLRPDGAYTYVLDEDASGAAGSETFSFEVDDGHKGRETGIITIDLDNANSAPVITGNLGAVVEGCVQEYAGGIVSRSGQLTWADAEGDAIGPVTVGGVVLSAGETTIEGAYGTLVVSLAEGRSGASWTYTLKPGMDGQGIDDVESFGVVVEDSYGAYVPASLDITLKPLTHAPECEDVLKNWDKTESGRPVSFIDGQLAFSDADTAYDPTESLHLTVNGEAVTESRQIQGKYGVLTIGPDGNFIYNYTLGTENFDVLEDFVYSVTDSKGYSDTAHLYIRLSDDAPAFPGAEQVPETPQGSQDAPAGMEGSDTAPQEDAPEPAEIGLASVPLPYDPADMGMPGAV
ncbi:MAG: hypothetical protein K2J64_08050 [Desulfovibrio sp.]|nr:hypothetical protein [Desulfovibrio sp.]